LGCGAATRGKRLDKSSEPAEYQAEEDRQVSPSKAITGAGRTEK